MCMRCGWEFGHTMKNAWVILVNENFTETTLIPWPDDEKINPHFLKDTDDNDMFVVKRFIADSWDEAKKYYNELINDPDKNPGWKRPSDWQYEEDWGSLVWNMRMNKNVQKRRAYVEAHGFIVCPECKTEHTALTITCRNCNYKAL